MSKMDLIDTERPGEFAKYLRTKRGTVKSPNRIVQAVVDEAHGQLQQEVTLHDFLNRGRVELVDQDSIQDGLPHSIVVFGLRCNLF